MQKFLDKFITEFQAEPDIDKRMGILAEFVNIYYDSDMDVVNGILEKELQICIKAKSIDGEAMIRFMLAYSALERAEIKKGTEEIEKVMKLFDRVKNHEIRGQIMNFLAFTHSHRGDFDKAFQYVYECIREAELAENSRNRYWGNYTLGVLHFDLKDLANSEKCYNEAAKGFAKVGNHYGVARSESGLASVMIQRENYEEAEKLLLRSLVYYREVEVSSGESRSLNDLGMIFSRKGKAEQALMYYTDSLTIRKRTGHLQGVATTLNEIAELSLNLNRYTDAEKYLLEAKEACEKVKNRSKLYRTHFLFSQLYRKTNEPWKALEHYELYDKLRSEVQGESANNKIKELQTKMATEKSEKETEIHRLKNVELKNAYEEIEIKQKEIIDSINYAKRIQLSLLPTEKYIERNLKRLNK